MTRAPDVEADLKQIAETAKRYLKEAGLDKQEEVRPEKKAGRYISVPTEIDAVQFTGSNFLEVQALAGQRDINGYKNEKFVPIGSYLIDYLNPGAKAELWVEANNQWLPIEVGEWIIRDSRGCYPCKDDIFRTKYKEI